MNLTVKVDLEDLWGDDYGEDLATTIRKEVHAVIIAEVRAIVRGAVKGDESLSETVLLCHREAAEDMLKAINDAFKRNR